MNKIEFCLPLTVAVTGHRDIPEVEYRSIKEKFSAWLVQLSREYPNTPIRLLSGLAEGADRIAVSAFLEVRDSLKNAKEFSIDAWEFVAILPMPKEVYQEDFPGSIDEFNTLLARATAVVVLPSPTPDSIRSNLSLRDECYEALGRHLIRHCNILATLWDGKVLELRGGTSQLVRLKLKGYEHASSSFAISLHDCGPVWRLPVSRLSGRDRKVGECEEPEWLYPSEAEMGKSTSIASFRAIDNFNERALKKISPESLEKIIRSLSPSEDAHKELVGKLGTLDRRVIAVHAAADCLAIDIERRRQRWTIILYILGAALAICLWTAVDNVLQLWMSAAYVIIILMLVLGFRRIRQPDLSDDPLSYRFLAEALRVQFYWSVGHAVEGNVHQSSHFRRIESWEILRVLDALLSQQAHEIGWLREALRIGAINPLSASDVRAELKYEFLSHWIKGQLAYFQKTERRHERRAKNIERASMLLAILAVASAAGVVFVDRQELDHNLRHMLAISAAVLPAFALLLQSFADRMALEEQQKSSIRMQSVFSRANLSFEREKKTIAQSAHLIRALGQEALAECAYWLILRKSKPPKMPT